MLKKNKNWPNFSNTLISKVVKVLKSGKINYTTGAYGKIFERKFSKYTHNKYSVAITNGTAALEVAIKSLKLKHRSEIIVPARSYFSSASCIINTGHIPVFADVNIITQNICVDDIKKKITKKTKVIICVHLGGNPCDMKEIIKIKNKYKLYVIEDCSQAHGAKINNRSVGSFGDIGTWSFCNDKILSTLGEGGMISTNRKSVYKFCSEYINHGTREIKKKKSEKFIYNKDTFGTNLRLTEIQSISGIEQLNQLNKIQKKRERISKNIQNVLIKYKNFLNFYKPPKNVKSAWYRFYFFLNKNIKNYKILRYKIIKDLRIRKIEAFTGSCPEIYLEKSFQRLNFINKKRLEICKYLSDISIALGINHTLSHSYLKKKIKNLDYVLKKHLIV